jgi:hypothetical protein
MVDRISKEEAARQFAAADKRVKGISSIADSTIKRTRVLEVEKQYGTIKGNKQAVSSVDKALRSLTKSTQALAMGVKAITVETARGVKSITQSGANVIGEYTKALSEDLHVKREGMLVALTAKTTPLIGYAIAKLFETSVFKNMIERMKSGLGKALNSVSTRFKRLASAGWEKSKEFWNSLRDKTSKKRGSINVQVKNAKKNQTGTAGSKNKLESQVPHMASGGYVKKEGLAKVHAAEVVQPVDKVVETIVDQVNKRMDAKEKKQKSFLSDTVFERTKGKKKDLFGFEKVGTSIRNAFEIMTRSNLNLERQIMRRDKMEKQGLIKSFITAYTEEAKQEELPLMERQVQATIELKKTISGQNKVAEAAWNKMLYEHPVFHAIYAMSKATIKYATMPVKMLFKKRGIYANRLSSRGTIFERLLDVMTNVFTGLMGKMDGLLGNTYISASATAKAQDGKAQGLTRAPKQPGYTIIGKGLKLAGKAGKMGLGVASKIGKWTIGSKMSQEEWDDKVNLVGKAKRKYGSAKDKVKGFFSKKIKGFADAAGEKRDSLLSRGKDWWNIKNLEDQKKYDFKRDFEKKRNKGKKQIKKLERAEWFKEQKEKFDDKLELYKKYAKEQDAIYRKSTRKRDMDESKWREGKVKGGTAGEQFKERKKQYEDYKASRKINKGDKDKSGQETQFKVFRDLRKFAKKNLFQNTIQAKSQKKLTKFMTGWRRFVDLFKSIGGGIISVVSGFMGMVGTTMSLLLGAFGIKWAMKPLKLLGTAAKWVSKTVFNTGKTVVEAGLKTQAGQKLAATGAGKAAIAGATAVGVGATTISKKMAARSATKLAAKEAAAKLAKEKLAKQTLKVAGQTGIKKIIGKASLATAGKKIPIIAGLVGVGLAMHRASKGDFAGAGAELVSGGLGAVGLWPASLVIDAGLVMRDIKKANKGDAKDKKHSNLSVDTVQKIKKLQASTLDYLPIFAGFTGSATAMVTASYLNRYGVNNPEALVSTANKIAGFSEKAWIEAGGNAAVHAGAVEISKAKGKISKLWDKGKGIFLDKTSDIYKQTKGFRKKASNVSDSMRDKAEDAYAKAQDKAKDMVKKGKDIYKDNSGDFTDKASKLYKNRGKIFDKGKEKAKSMYAGFKQRAMDATDKMPTMMSKLGENIVEAFMKFGNFLSEAMGDPAEHFKNMKEKVFKGITSARKSLASIYTKIHDLVEVQTTMLQMKLVDYRNRMKMRSRKRKIWNFLTGNDDNFGLPNFLSPLAKISAGAGAGFKFNQDSNFMVGKGHKGETMINGGKGMSFMTPDNVRETLFGGLGINSKKVASMAAGQGIHDSGQNDELKNSIERMKETLEITAKASAGSMSAVIDKSVKIMSSNTTSSNNNAGGGNPSSQPRSRDPYIDYLLGCKIT